MAEPVLSCKGLTFRYRSEDAPVFSNLSLTVSRGEAVLLMGPSGCGKSTLGRTILNLLPATSGEVIFDGVHVENADRRQMRKLRQEMQIIFQDPYSALDPHHNVEEIIREPMSLYTNASKSDIDEPVSYTHLRAHET